MLTSELIKELQVYLHEYGDLDVMVDSVYLEGLAHLKTTFIGTDAHLPQDKTDKVILELDDY